jgi:hypothetical protein
LVSRSLELSVETSFCNEVFSNSYFSTCELSHHYLHSQAMQQIERTIVSSLSSKVWLIFWSFRWLSNNLWKKKLKAIL